MNKNIEVINENLWAVEFDYVHMGYIKGLSFNNPNPSDYASLTQDGKIILNKNKPICKDMTRYLSIIMKMPNARLGSDRGFYNFIKFINPKIKKFSDKQMETFIQENKLDSVKQLFFNLSNIEIERRRIQKLFNKKFNQLGKEV